MEALVRAAGRVSPVPMAHRSCALARLFLGGSRGYLPEVRPKLSMAAQAPELTLSLRVRPVGRRGHSPESGIVYRGRARQQQARGQVHGSAEPIVTKSATLGSPILRSVRSWIVVDAHSRRVVDWFIGSAR